MNLLKTLKTRTSRILTWFLNLSVLKKLITISLLLFLGWFVWQRITSLNNDQIQYQTTKAERGTLISSVTASGVISSASSSNITSSATGVVNAVYVKNGDNVIVGQTIAEVTLDGDSLQRQTQAWASYLSAQNSLNSAKSKMNSLQATLFEANQEFVKGAGTNDPIEDDPTYIIQRANWLQAESDYNNQANVIRQAEAALSSAWISYQQISSTITAPSDGAVTNLSLAPGQTLVATTNASSTVQSQTYGGIIVEGGKLQSTVNISEVDAPKVEIGQKVTMTLDAFSDKTFTGKVSAVNTNGTTSSGVTIYPTTITFDTTVNKIYPNMAVNATIITHIKGDILILPSSAVQTNDSGSTVQVMKNGQIQDINVEIGDSNDTQIEIKSGISEGDVVITGQTGGASTTTRSGGTSVFSPRGFGGAGGGQIRIQR